MLLLHGANWWSILAGIPEQLDLQAVSAVIVEPPMRRFGRSDRSVEYRISAHEECVRVKLYRHPGQWILKDGLIQCGVQLKTSVAHKGVPSDWPKHISC